MLISTRTLFFTYRVAPALFHVMRCLHYFPGRASQAGPGQYDGDWSRWAPTVLGTILFLLLMGVTADSRAAVVSCWGAQLDLGTKDRPQGREALPGKLTVCIWPLHTTTAPFKATVPLTNQTRAFSLRLADGNSASTCREGAVPSRRAALQGWPCLLPTPEFSP